MYIGVVDIMAESYLSLHGGEIGRNVALILCVAVSFGRFITDAAFIS